MQTVPVILYVEDNPDDVYFFERARTKLAWPHLWQHASNGLEAQDILLGVGKFAERSEWPRPTAVLSDNKMPLMTGLELLDWMRKEPAFMQLPFYLLTTSDHDMDIEAATKLSVTAYIRKPSNADDYVACVRNLFEAITRGGPAGE